MVRANNNSNKKNITPELKVTKRVYSYKQLQNCIKVGFFLQQETNMTLL